MIRYQIVSWQCTLQNCKFLSEHHHISWKKLFQETTVLSYKFVRDTTSLGFQNKRNCSLWGYSNKNHSVVVFLTRKSLLWQGSLVAFQWTPQNCQWQQLFPCQRHTGNTGAWSSKVDACLASKQRETISCPLPKSNGKIFLKWLKSIQQNGRQDPLMVH